MGEETTQLEAGSVTINTNLLDMLREATGFSPGRYGSLDDIIENTEAEFARTLGTFIGEGFEFELAGVTLFAGAEQTGEIQDRPVYVQVGGGDNSAVCFVGISTGTFRQFLKVLFGSAGEKNAGPDRLPLTAGENKIFCRICQQLGAGFLKILNLHSDDNAEHWFSIAEDKFLNTISAKTELVSIGFELMIMGAKQPITLLAPLEILEPSSFLNIEDGATQMQQQEIAWQKKLHGRIDGLMIPLQAQFASFDVPLIDIALLKEGSSLDFHFDLKKVRITDCDDNCAFIADIDLRKKNILLRVTGAAKTTGV